MSFTQKLTGSQSSVIQEALFSILNDITTPDVLELDKEFRNTADKHALLAEFEASDNKPSKRDPALLERWTHYCWIRLELTYLANQKATLNQITATKNEINQFQQSTNSSDDVFHIPAMLDSVNRAIQDDAMRGVPITQSINILKQMKLQIVGTEHPTDPLSQEARNTLTDIAIAIDEKNPDENNIKKLLLNLQNSDAIPPAKHTVAEEVSRNIRITLEKLYDNLPHLIQEILNAYKKHYGMAAYTQHEDDILQALEGGKQADGTISPPIVHDASWPGFDADGNENITASSMYLAIRLYRVRAAEKHIASLDSGIGETAKKIERELRVMISKLNMEVFKQTLNIEEKKEILFNIYQYQNEASQLLIDRKFSALLLHYKNLQQYLNALEVEKTIKEQLLNLVNKQFAAAEQLVALTNFSGSHRVNESLNLGAIQKFQAIFAQYKDAIRDNTDAIAIKDKQGALQPAIKIVSDHYHDLLREHRDILKSYPELYMQMRHFGVQLHSFGLTFGVGHIRQDSSIFVKVWNTILEDLKMDSELSQYAIFQPLKDRSYCKLTESERIALHKQLQNGSEESKKILDVIYHKHKDSKYLSEIKYKNNPDFAWVRSELDRLKVTIRHNDMFENIIISNCESAANILEVASLLRVFPEEAKQQNLTIVPLLEKPLDLKNYENILVDYIKTRIQQKLETDFTLEEKAAQSTLKNILQVQFRDEIKSLIEAKSRHDFKQWILRNPKLSRYLQSITVEIMVGFSDTERVSGISALIAVQQVQEDYIQMAKDFGITPKIYHGPGGDPNRGGLRRHDQKATLQGNARSNVLNTAKSTQWFRENQFYRTYKNISDPSHRMEFSRLPQPMHQWLSTCMQEGMFFYEQLHDTNDGLGKLLGFMLGQGANWMVTILNSSSRATQRGVAEKNGDRTASVQTNGIRPDAYIHPDKPRAITATQMKEMLRDYLDFIGSCYGLRKIGQEKVERLYDMSETFRDMVEKNVLGAAMRDLSFMAHTLFANHPELLPKNKEQRKEWAKECQEKFPGLLKNMDIEKMSKQLGNREELLTMLSRLFAYIEDECEQTQEFLFKMNHSIHCDQYAQKEAPHQVKQASDLLYHYPVWHEQTKDITREVEPLSFVFARQSQHIANGKNLDQIYSGLNAQNIPDSRLSGVGRLVANVGAGITAARITQPGYNENIHLDYRENLRPGVARAEVEAMKLNRPIQTPRTKNTVWQLFQPEMKNHFEETLKNLPAVRRKFST